MKRSVAASAMAVALVALALLALAGPTPPAGASPDEPAGRSAPQLSTTCDSCSSCNTALKNPLYSTVQLTADISDRVGTCISLNGSSYSNLTFDCNGHTIDGDGVDSQEWYDPGIEMYNDSNNTVQNCTITDFDIGIYFKNTTGHQALNNTVENHYWGIWTDGGGSATVQNNDVRDNSWGITVTDGDGHSISDNTACQNATLDFSLTDSTGNSGDNNTCDKPDGWSDQGTTGCTSPCAGTATCTDCADCTSKLDGSKQTVLLVSNVYDQSGSCITFGADNVVFDCGGRFLDGDGGGGDGITISGHSGNTIRNCTIKEFYDGIWLSGAASNTIENNQITASTNNGVHLFNSDNNTISTNEIGASSDYGVMLNNSDNNELTGNTMRCNGYGLGLLDATSTTANANTICSNPGPDFYVQGTTSGSSGTANRCDMPGSWNDGGASGCTSSCKSLRCTRCTDGIWAVDEDGIDCGGLYCPPCSQCADEPTNKYAPPDTICDDDWPTTDGVWTGLNDYTASCNLVEVCNPDLDYIIEDALRCCESGDYMSVYTGSRGGEKASACYSALGRAYRHNFANQFNTTSLDQCLGYYIIASLEPNPAYMQDYFHGELCCVDHSLCPDTCDKWNVSPPAWEMGTAQDCRGGGTSPDFAMAGHVCEYFDTGIFGKIGVRGQWNSDTNYKFNRDGFFDVPPHASVNQLSTGTCVDYSLVVTTLLRKAGYAKDDVLSVDGVRHAYNLVRFPGETKWHYVDTTANGAGGIMGGSGNPEPWQSWYTIGGPWKHCSGVDEGCLNDVYGKSMGHCPANTMIYGCEWVSRSAVQTADPEPDLAGQAAPASPSSSGADPSCTELHPCLETSDVEAQAPGPGLDIGWDKAISSPEIVLGQDVQITIQVDNHEATTIDVLVQEKLPPNMDHDLAMEGIVQDGNTIPLHKRWLEIPAGGSETLAYVVVPTTTGHYEFPPTTLLAGERSYQTGVVSLDVMCDPDGVCDAGENFVLCPADCTTGLEDDLCDMVADGIQDPDCEYGVDPDFFPFSDTDGDGKLDAFDACALTPAGENVNSDGCSCSQQICDDGDPTTLDGCDPVLVWCTFSPDGDQDDVADASDNCPNTYNPDQIDSDGDGTGDQCAVGPVDGDTTLDPGPYIIAAPEGQPAIVVGSSGVTLDCNGATITGDGSGYGIHVPAGLEGVTILNCTVRNYRYGIYVDGAIGTNLVDNRLEGNGYGIIIGEAVDSILTGNTASGNSHAGLYLEGSTGHQISGNTINSNLNRGIFLHTSPDNDLTANTVCFNTIADLEVYDSAGTGDDNTCDVPGDWNDAGSTGCAERCVQQRIYLPLVLRQ